MRTTLLFIVMTFGIFLTSCQDTSNLDNCENGMTLSPFTTSNTNTLDALQAFNDSLASSRYMNAEINKFDQQKFNDAVNIAWADVQGAYTGARLGWYVGCLFGPNGGAIGASIVAPIFAAGKSYNKATDIKNKTRADNYVNFNDCIYASVYMQENVSDFHPYYPKYIKAPVPAGSINCDKAGVIHNLILDNIVKNNFSNTSIYEIYSPLECCILTHEDVIKCFDEGTADLPYMQDTSDYDLTATRILAKYINAIMSSATSYSTIQLISRKYILEVQRSTELDTLNKERLYAAFSVMNSTAEYWEMFDNSDD